MDILIVDSDADFSGKLRNNLRNIGRKCDLLECCERVSGAALRKNYQLLIINIENTGDRCSQFIEQFSQARNTPVIVVSRNAELDAKIHHLKVGAVDYVVKPVDFEELIARVDLQLRKRIST